MDQNDFRTRWLAPGLKVVVYGHRSLNRYDGAIYATNCLSGAGRTQARNPLGTMQTVRPTSHGMW